MRCPPPLPARLLLAKLPNCAMKVPWNHLFLLPQTEVATNMVEGGSQTWQRHPHAAGFRDITDERERGL